MALKVDVCEDADMYRFFEIYSETFGLGEEYINVVFPNHSSPEGRTIGGKRMLDIKKSDPNTTFLKVTDTATSEMIGLAKWNIYDGFIPPETGLDTTEFWDTSEEAAYADALHRSFLKDRRAAIKSAGGHILTLDIMAVHPKHQRRGAGRILVDWGTKIADEMGVETVVESSTRARHLYETCGFRGQQSVAVEPPKEFEHLAKQKQEYIWMTRAKKSHGA